MATTSQICTRATQVYSLDCSDRYWKQAQATMLESPPVGKQMKIIAAEDAVGTSSPPGFHKRPQHRGVHHWSTGVTSPPPPVDPYHKFSPSALQPRSGSPHLAEQAANGLASTYAPPCYRVFPAANPPAPMSPLAAEVYRQWSPSNGASPVRPWHTRGGGFSSRTSGGASSHQSSATELIAAQPPLRMAATTRPALGIVNTGLHHVSRPIGGGGVYEPPSKTNASNLSSPNSAVKSNSISPSSLPPPLPPPPPLPSATTNATASPNAQLSESTRAPTDPTLEIRKAFACEVQRRVKSNRVDPLLPDSIAKLDLEDRAAIDMSAYTATAFPATLAYVEAMGTLLHRIIDISYPRHRYEKQFRFDAVSVPEVAIGDYLERLRCFFLCSPECFVLAMIYIDRLVRLYDGKVVLCSLNIHRILVTAVMISAKFFDDVYYSNSFYAKIGGLSLEEMNVLESHFLHLIKYDLYVSPREYERYRHNVTLLHASSNPLPKISLPSVKSISTASNTPLQQESELVESPPASVKRTWPEGPLFEESPHHEEITTDDPPSRNCYTRLKEQTSPPNQSARDKDLLVSTSSTHCSTPSNNEFPSPST